MTGGGPGKPATPSYQYSAREWSWRAGRHAPLEGPSTRGARAWRPTARPCVMARGEQGSRCILVRRGPVFAFDVVCVFVVVVSIATFFCPSLSHRPLPSFHAPLQLAPVRVR